jgi:FKBP-type peptidyl-prolyl cis-trans isomerase FklB
MNKTILVITASMFALGSFAQVKKSVNAAKLATNAAPKSTSVTPVKPFKNNTDSISYAVGLRIGQSLKAQGFDNLNMAMFEKALSDVKLNKAALLDDAAITACISAYQMKANEAKSAASKAKGVFFLANNAKRPGVVTLPSGLQYEVMKAGTNTTKPTLASTVTCHYTGTLVDGTKFESSLDRGTPAKFPLGNVIRGWQEAIQLMTVGSKWKLFIPSDMAYGDNPRPGGAIQPGDTLIFEVELLEIEN